MFMKRVFFCLSLLSTLLYGRESSPTPNPPPGSPWLTGPLLTPSGHTVPAPHVNYEPYIYWYQYDGAYDKNWNSHSSSTLNQVQAQATFQIGVNSFTEFDIAPQFSYQQKKGQHDWRVNDVPIALGFQILKDKHGEWWPAIKLRFGANIPIGKYQKFDARKNGTDAGGSGDWNPSAGFVLSRLFHFGGVHFLATRYFIAYVVPHPVHVKGINAYGGAHGTHGTVYPGNQVLALVGLEFTMTQNWALAFDAQYVHANKNRFSGHSGGAAPKAPSSEQFSIAPALEYNWNANIGIIGGAWFTVGGRNTATFMTGVFALNIYH